MSSSEGIGGVPEPPPDVLKGSEIEDPVPVFTPTEPDSTACPPITPTEAVPEEHQLGEATGGASLETSPSSSHSHMAEDEVNTVVGARLTPKALTPTGRKRSAQRARRTGAPLRSEGAGVSAKLASAPESPTLSSSAVDEPARDATAEPVAHEEAASHGDSTGSDDGARSMVGPSETVGQKRARPRQREPTTSRKKAKLAAAAAPETLSTDALPVLRASVQCAPSAAVPPTPELSGANTPPSTTTPPAEVVPLAGTTRAPPVEESSEGGDERRQGPETDVAEDGTPGPHASTRHRLAEGAPNTNGSHHDQHSAPPATLPPSSARVPHDSATDGVSPPSTMLPFPSLRSVTANVAGVNIAALLADSNNPPPTFSRRAPTRRARRRPTLFADHPQFLQHRELRTIVRNRRGANASGGGGGSVGGNTVHGMVMGSHGHLYPPFFTSPFSTDEDVLHTLNEWTDSVPLVYASLLWKYTPQAFLASALAHSPCATKVEPDQDASESKIEGVPLRSTFGGAAVKQEKPDGGGEVP